MSYVEGGGRRAKPRVCTGGGAEGTVEAAKIRNWRQRTRHHPQLELKNNAE